MPKIMWKSWDTKEIWWWPEDSENLAVPGYFNRAMQCTLVGVASNGMAKEKWVEDERQTYFIPKDIETTKGHSKGHSKGRISSQEETYNTGRIQST
jgi:hypothetical protein